jgi:hypothetical protein
MRPIRIHGLGLIYDWILSIILDYLNQDVKRYLAGSYSIVYYDGLIEEWNVF